MTDLQLCQACSAKMPVGNPGPICPACMLENALGKDSYVELTEIQPGRNFCGHEIVRKLGVGGMGVVYEARQQSLSRSVALKMIRAPNAATEKDMARFRQEAEAAARLNHPNIVEVYEIGEIDGSPYFTMKYVEGAHSLGSELARGPFQAKRAAQLVCQIARAVSYAHQRGVIHRDLKPANILLDPEDRPCLVDFGLAKLFGETPSLSRSLQALSDDGKLIGTPHYMSPEQIRGDDLTTSTDIYSLGAVLYELLTGKPPFQSRTLTDMLEEISHVSPKPPSSSCMNLSRDLEVICLKCLRKQTKNRYATADDLADDLERWLENRPIQARPTTTGDRITKWARRNPGVASLSAVVAVLAMVLIGLFAWLWINSKNDLIALVEKPLADAKIYRNELLAGRRWEAIDALKLGTPNLSALPAKDRESFRRDYQNEAIACLSLIDMRPSEEHADSWEGDPDECGLVRMSPDFDSYAHAMKDGSVVVRDRRSNKEQLLLEASESAECLSLRFDPSGQRLAAVYRENGTGFRFVVWSMGSGDSIHRGQINGPEALDFSADGSLIVVATEKSIAITPLDNPGTARVKPISFTATCLRLNGDTTVLAASSTDGSAATLFDFETGEPLETSSGPKIGAGARVLDLAWNPRGRWLALACSDGRVVIWDTENAANSMEQDVIELSSEKLSAIEHIGWHPRGVLIAGTSSSAKVHLWHAAKGVREVTWSGTMGPPQFSPDSADSSRLGPAIDGTNVSLLEVAEGRVVSHARGHPGRIYGCWWRDHSRLFATAGDDGVRLWNRRGFEMAIIPETDARAALFTDQSLIITGSSGLSVYPISEGGANPRSKTVRLGKPQPYLDGIRCYDADIYVPKDDSSNPSRLAVATTLEVDGEADGESHVRVFLRDPKTGQLSLEKELSAPAGTAFVEFSDDGEWLAAGTDETNGGSGVRVWKTGGSWELQQGPYPQSGSADVVFYHVPPEYPSKHHWLVTAGTSEYRFYEMGSWKFRQAIEVDRGKELGAISFSPRTPVFAISGRRFLSIYSLYRLDDELISPEFAMMDPVSFSPGGIILTTTEWGENDHNMHLHLWDLRLLRAELLELELDLIGLESFKDTPEPSLIDSVLLE